MFVELEVVSLDRVAHFTLSTAIKDGEQKLLAYPMIESIDVLCGDDGKRWLGYVNSETR